MNLLENAVVQEQRRIEYMIKKYETELTTIYSIAAGKRQFQSMSGEQEIKLKDCSNRLNGAGIFRSC